MCHSANDTDIGILPGSWSVSPTATAAISSFSAHHDSPPRQPTTAAHHDTRPPPVALHQRFSDPGPRPRPRPRPRRAAVQKKHPLKERAAKLGPILIAGPTSGLTLLGPSSPVRRGRADTLLSSLPPTSTPANRRPRFSLRVSVSIVQPTGSLVSPRRTTPRRPPPEAHLHHAGQQPKGRYCKVRRDHGHY